MDPENLLKLTREWPVEDRLNFLYRMWDDLLDGGWQPVPSEEMLAELDRRLAAHEANPNDVRTEEQLLERIRGRK